MQRLLLILSFMALTCCTQMCGEGRGDLTPEQVVERYLEISMTMTDPSQKESLLDLTTGVLHSSINSATDETIKKAFIDKEYANSQWMIVERRDRTPRETEITFELSYRDLSQNPKGKAEDAPEIITENTVAVIRKEGAWSIRDVIGKKTSIDFPVGGDVIRASPNGSP